MGNKFSDFFLRFKINYDARQVRNSRMDKFLDDAEKRNDEMKDLTYTVKSLSN